MAVAAMLATACGGEDTGDGEGESAEATESSTAGDDGTTSGTGDTTGNDDGAETTAEDGTTSEDEGESEGDTGDTGETTGGGALEDLSDEFDDPGTLGDWLRIYETEQWPYDQLETYDIGDSSAGFLTMVPHTSSWFEDYRGLLAYKEVPGDFVATTRLIASSRAGGAPPSNDFSLAGIMVRAPRDITAQTWMPGGENYIFLSLGRGDDQQNPGGYENEVKTTIDSQSTLAITPAAGPDMEIRTARVGQYFLLLIRETGGAWAVHRRYDRPDMPSELQVGMVAYTDWGAISQVEPAVYNNWTEPPAAGTPDLRAEFDYFRFATPEVPEAWAGLDLTDPAVVTDEDVLAVLGQD